MSKTVKKFSIRKKKNQILVLHPKLAEANLSADLQIDSDVVGLTQNFDLLACV